MEFGGRAERRLRHGCARAGPACGRSSCTSTRGCRRPPPTPTSSWRASPAPKACWRWRSPALVDKSSADAANTRRRRCRRRPACRRRRSSGWRASLRRTVRRSRSSAARRSRTPTACSMRRRSTTLNRAAKAVNQPGGVSFIPQGPRRRDAAASSEILRGDAPKVLLIDDVNPVYSDRRRRGRSPMRLKRVPFIVSFGSFIDETSALADLILPDHSFLESWVDAAPESGSAKAVRDEVRSGDAAALRHALDSRRVARGVARARQADCRPAEYVRRVS